jgi:hypothetical protein
MAVVAGVDNPFEKLGDYSRSQVMNHPILKKRQSA